MEGPPRYPFEILPAEVWEMIIFEVKDSEDLRNLLKASKQLTDTFIKIRHWWLLDKVLPILMPITEPKSTHYLEAKDLKILRLVDKRWCRGVNAFLENQPRLRPYNKGDDKLNSAEHILSESCIGYNSYLKEPKIGSVAFSSYSDLSKFRRMFRNSKRNPFPARSLFGKTQPDYTIESPLEEEEKLEFWGEMDKEVFRKHGKHIWFLRMKWDRFYFQYHRQSRADSVWKWIVKSLSSLPNLKGIHLDFNDVGKSEMSISDCEAEEILKLEGNQLPHMQFLESLKLSPTDGTPELFIQQLLSKYSMQIRRLMISTISLKMREKWTFPNLTELIIDYMNVGDNVTQILTSLEAPLLTKLQFICSNEVVRYYNLVKIDIFPWIALFPSLLHLNMPCEGFDIRESGAFGNPQDSNYSLKYLKIGRSRDLKYNFLRYLPNLQQLQICSGRGVNKLFCKLHVWQLSPKLRTFLVTQHHWKKNYEVFHREAYETLAYERRTGPAESPQYSYENRRRSGRTKSKLSPV